MHDFDILSLTSDFETLQHFKLSCQTQFSVTMHQTCIMSGIVVEQNY